MFNVKWRVSSGQSAIGRKRTPSPPPIYSQWRLLTWNVLKTQRVR